MLSIIKMQVVRDGNNLLKMCYFRKKAITEIFFIVEESPEGGYEAKVLGYSILQKRNPLCS